MAEYNPSKIIKDGNTYNFRDTTKIPLAGSNAISGSLIPSTDGTVNLGSPSYQWNQAYIKSLTINGIACGDILTHNVSEFVGVSSNQTIGGIKTFSNIPIVVNGKSYVSKINANRTNGTQADFSAYNGFRIVCNNDSQAWNNTVFAIHVPEYSPTRATVGFKLYDCIEGGTSYKGFGFSKNNNDYQLFPTASNVINLGSPSSQWNTTYTRNILIDNDINITSSLINKTSTSGVISIRGGLNTQDGASIGLYGKDYNGGIAGNIYMTAYGNSDYTNFRIYPSGVMSVYNNSTATTKNVAMQEDTIPRSGGQVFTGTLFTRINTSDNLTFRSGPYYADGASLQLKGKNQADASGGRAYITAHNGTRNTGLVIWPTGEVILDGALTLKTNADNTCSCGASDRRWTEVYAATGTINTSDSRFKNSVKDIDNTLLDAWENIEPKQYKFNDATEKKGEKARFHTGYLAQDIQAECEKQGINASDYGLFCYDEWEEQEEISEEIETEKDGKVVKEKHVIQPKREKGNSYALRYEEALVVECKYLRRCITRLTARIEQLEGVQNK